MSDLTRWLIALALSTIAVVISYEWFDRSIVFFVHDHFARSSQLTRLFLYFSTLLAPLAGIVMVPLGLRALTRRPLSYAYTVMVLCCASFLASEGIKPYLKHAFGRTWPDTIVGDYASLLSTGEYGFFPFRQSYFAYGAFPSGHMSAVCAVLAVLWLCYPRFKLFYAAVALLAAAILILLNFHFLSDVIAGAFLGSSIGWIATALWRNGTQA